MVALLNSYWVFSLLMTPKGHEILAVLFLLFLLSLLIGLPMISVWIADQWSARDAEKAEILEELNKVKKINWLLDKEIQDLQEKLRKAKGGA